MSFWEWLWPDLYSGLPLFNCGLKCGKISVKTCEKCDLKDVCNIYAEHANDKKEETK